MTVEPAYGREGDRFRTTGEPSYGCERVKKIGLDVNNLSNYHPVTNLTHLSKIIERAMLDQLVPFLEEVGVVPRYQSAYRKLYSTETALCKIHDDLVSNTCHGKASLSVLLDLSAAFDTVDHQLLLSDFSDLS